MLGIKEIKNKQTNCDAKVKWLYFEDIFDLGVLEIKWKFLVLVVVNVFKTYLDVYVCVCLVKLAKLIQGWKRHYEHKQIVHGRASDRKWSDDFVLRTWQVRPENN